MPPSPQTPLERLALASMQALATDGAQTKASASLQPAPSMPDGSAQGPSGYRMKIKMRMFLFGASLGPLHARTVVVNERLACIGSMNLDPRSATLNAELGALIDSRALAMQLKTLIDIDRLHSAYALRLAADGSCRESVISDSDGRLVLSLEPDSRWWMHWLGSLLQPLTPEDHL